MASFNSCTCTNYYSNANITEGLNFNSCTCTNYYRLYAPCTASPYHFNSCTCTNYYLWEVLQDCHDF